MVIVVASKSRYVGSVTPPALNTETTVVEIPAQTDDYIVEGYISLQNLASGDTVVIREYIAVDGVNYVQFVSVTYSGAVENPAVRFHAKLFTYNMKYKVTVTQTGGTLRSYPYGFILEVLGEM